ncbi:MAG: ATP-binding cassette domain-containing protein [Gammaproteobacteria bacterium]|nr:MAG: ATP-binding cassette domain-containing protein [Gammaproteobacteria bacterium]
MEIVVKAEKVGKVVATSEGALQIMQDISLKLHAGESMAVVGSSGSGKSTLLGLLAGLDLPSSGIVELLGRRLHEMDEDGRARLRAKQLGFVFQAFHLLPTLNAIENVLMPLELMAVPDAQSMALNALSEVGLAKRIHHYPAQLSGGEQQRVAIARAFVTQPKILFADEPTGNLDAATGDHIAELLFELQRQNKTALILATHDQVLTKNCDQLFSMDHMAGSGS